MKQTTTRVKSIMEFFGVNAREVMGLTKEDREELGPLCAGALGKEIEAEVAA